MTKKNKYLLKFCDAMARAINDGVQIEQEAKNGLSTYPIHYVPITGDFYYEDNSGPVKTNLNDLLGRPWRVVEKPKRVEFECECEWLQHSRDDLVHFPCTYSENTAPFIGKRTKVTIEEVIE